MARQTAIEVAEAEVRVAVEADIPAVVALINVAYRVEDFFIAGDRTDAADIHAHMTEGQFLIAEFENTGVRGTVYVQAKGGRGYFGMLSVAPEAQGSGIGRFLVDRAEQHCFERGATAMDLLVVNLREELLPWYERLGYIASGTEPFEAPGKLKRTAHFITMSKELRQNS
jgi:ribosomal protein S18 acetylase RimI-like enzyme